MKRNFLFVVAIIGAVILAWWAGYKLYDNKDKNSSSPAIVKQTKVKPPKLKQPGFEMQRDGRTSSTEEVIQDRKVEYAKTLRYLGWEADTAGTSPKACFNFSQKLKQGSETALRDYVVTKPKIPVNITINGSQMCAAGFGFEKDYSLTLREGLPSEDEKIKLETAQTVEISFGDKPGFVGFAGQGIILPRSNASRH